MTSTSNADCLISAVYEAVLEPDRWPEVLARLAAYFGVDGVIFGSVSLERLWEGEVWSHGVGPDAVAALSDSEIMGRSVYASALRVLPLDQPARLAAFGSERLYREDVGAQAILTPQDFRDGLFGPVSREEGALVPIACLCEGRRGPLDPGAASRLAALAPHLRRAMALHRRHRALEADRALVAGALGPLALGVVVVEADLRVRFANPEAGRILAEADGLALCRGRLAFADRAREAELRDGIERPGHGGVATYLFLQRPSGAPDYTLCLGPAQALRGIPGGAATIFLTDPAGPATLPAPDLLAARFALTASEAEVARLAAMGRGMPFVADRLGVSINTARTHLKAVYSKTGASSQAALGRAIVASFPPVRSMSAGQEATGR